MTLHEQIRAGALRALDKRISFRRAEVARHTQEDQTAAGDRFLKRSPEATSNERIMQALIDARAEVVSMNLESSAARHGVR